MSVRAQERSPNNDQRLRIVRRSACSLLVIAVVAAVVYLSAFWFVRSRADVTLSRVRKAVERHDAAAARRELRWLFWFDGGRADVRFYEGMCLHLEDDYAAAAERFRSIPSGHRLHEDAGFALAVTLLRDARYDEAEVVLREHMRQYPQSHAARNRLRWLYTTLARYRDAAAVLEHSLTLQPPDLTVMPELLKMQIGAVNPLTSIEVLEDVDARRPDQAGVLEALGRSFHARGETKRAESHLRRAHKIAPNDRRIRLALCGLLIETGQTKEAAELISATTPFPDADNVSGRSDVLRNREARRLREDRYWWHRSRLAADDGRLEDALADVDRALEILPAEPEYRTHRARLLQRLDRPDEAAAEYNRIAALNDDQVAFYDFSKSLANRMPTPDEARYVAALFERSGKQLQAEAWRLLSLPAPGQASGASVPPPLFDQLQRAPPDV